MSATNLSRLSNPGLGSKFLETLRTTSSGSEDPFRPVNAPWEPWPLLTAGEPTKLWTQDAFSWTSTQHGSRLQDTDPSAYSATTRLLGAGPGTGANLLQAPCAEATTLGPLLASMADILKEPGPDLTTPVYSSMWHNAGNIPNVKAKPLDTEQPTFGELSCWLIDCDNRPPGSRPIQGALELSAVDTDDLLRGAFAREERDLSSISRGAGGLADPRRSTLTAEILSTAKAVVRGSRRSPGIPIARDTILLALVLMARYIGEVEGDAGEPSSEDSLLPAVCLNMAYKMDESLACDLLRSLLLIVTPWKQEEYLPMAKVMAQLETKILTKLGFMLRSETPYTFLHHFLARVRALECLTQEEIADVGRAAAQTAFAWTNKGLLASFKPSEVAAVALDCAVRKLVSDEAAIGVARAARCSTWSPRFSPLYEENGLSSPFALDSDSSSDNSADSLQTDTRDQEADCGDGIEGKTPYGSSIKGTSHTDAEKYDTEDTTPPVSMEATGSDDGSYFSTNENALNIGAAHHQAPTTQNSSSPPLGSESGLSISTSSTSSIAAGAIEDILSLDFPEAVAGGCCDEETKELGPSPDVKVLALRNHVTCSSELTGAGITNATPSPFHAMAAEPITSGVPQESPNVLERACSTNASSNVPGPSPEEEAAPALENAHPPATACAQFLAPPGAEMVNNAPDEELPIPAKQPERDSAKASEGQAPPYADVDNSSPTLRACSSSSAGGESLAPPTRRALDVEQEKCYVSAEIRGQMRAGVPNATEANGTSLDSQRDASQNGQRGARSNDGGKGIGCLYDMIFEAYLHHPATATLSKDASARRTTPARDSSNGESLHGLEADDDSEQSSGSQSSTVFTGSHVPQSRPSDTISPRPATLTASDDSVSDEGATPSPRMIDPNGDEPPTPAAAISIESVVNDGRDAPTVPIEEDINVVVTGPAHHACLGQDPCNGASNVSTEGDFPNSASFDEESQSSSAVDKKRICGSGECAAPEAWNTRQGGEAARIPLPSHGTTASAKKGTSSQNLVPDSTSICPAREVVESASDASASSLSGRNATAAASGQQAGLTARRASRALDAQTARLAAADGSGTARVGKQAIAFSPIALPSDAAQIQSLGSTDGTKLGLERAPLASNWAIWSEDEVEKSEPMGPPRTIESAAVKIARPQGRCSNDASPTRERVRGSSAAEIEPRVQQSTKKSSIFARVVSGALRVFGCSAKDVPPVGVPCGSTSAQPHHEAPPFYKLCSSRKRGKGAKYGRAGTFGLLVMHADAPPAPPAVSADFPGHRCRGVRYNAYRSFVPV